MKNFLSGGAFKYALDHKLDTRYFGLLTSPSSANNPQHAIDHDLLWACDNDCFLNYNRDAICKMLKKYQGLRNCIFVNAPDVVRNHRATLRRFNIWERIIHGLGYPVAFTIQNGCTVDLVPWNKCDAIFIGGDNYYKYSSTVREIVKEASNINMWVHNGRVNTPERIIYSRNIGCTSFDGTGYSIYPPKIKDMWAYHTGAKQPFLLDHIEG